MIVIPHVSSLQLTGIVSTELGASVDPSSASLTVAPRLLEERTKGIILVQPALYRASLILNSSDAADLNPLIDSLGFGPILAGVRVFSFSTVNTGVEAFWPSRKQGIISNYTEKERGHATPIVVV